MANCLRAFYKKLINKKIILNTYAQMLRKYYGKNKTKLLKYRFTDTSFIYSRNGGTFTKFNKYFGRFWIRDTQEIRNVLKSLKFTPLISHNKRNTKDVGKRS